MATIWCLPCPFSQNMAFFRKRPWKSTIFEKIKFFFCISCSIFIGLFNGLLFVFIMSMVGGTQKETLLPSHLNWPPLYICTCSGPSWPMNLKGILLIFPWDIYDWQLPQSLIIYGGTINVMKVSSFWQKFLLLEMMYKFS